MEIIKGPTVNFFGTVGDQNEKKNFRDQNRTSDKY